MIIYILKSLIHIDIIVSDSSDLSVVISPFLKQKCSYFSNKISIFIYYHNERKVFQYISILSNIT